MSATFRVTKNHTTYNIATVLTSSWLYNTIFFPTLRQSLPTGTAGELTVWPVIAGTGSAGFSPILFLTDTQDTNTVG